MNKIYCSQSSVTWSGSIFVLMLTDAIAQLITWFRAKLRLMQSINRSSEDSLNELNPTYSLSPYKEWNRAAWWKIEQTYGPVNGVFSAFPCLFSSFPHRDIPEEDYFKWFSAAERIFQSLISQHWEFNFFLRKKSSEADHSINQSSDCATQIHAISPDRKKKEGGA